MDLLIKKNKDLSKEPVLLMTATVFPQENRYIRITNPNHRLKQYIESLKFYIIHSNIKKIVLCDNSGYMFQKNKLIRLAKKYSKEIEILSFYGNKEKIKKYGKGYGEGEIIKYALANSRILKNANYFIKVTGRIRIININKILQKIDLKKIYINKNHGIQKAMDTIIYCVPKKTYTYFFENSYQYVYDNKGIYIEHIFYKVIYDNKIKVYNLPYFPKIDGLSGSTGVQYQKHMGYRRYLYDFISRINFYNVGWVQKILN